jgi:hypothetical protein
MTDREKVVRVIRAVFDALHPQGAQPWDDDDVNERIATACDSVGISPHDYRRIVDSDSLLAELERRATGEASADGRGAGAHAGPPEPDASLPR